mmetsp:Transcript_9789/g.5112  ORF Transcript_9789/g.5112 Transcript_9789/m.5112 type:complete len:114 (+) Transcript_9789:67-408(+)
MHTGTGLATLKSLGPNAPEGVWGTSSYLFYYPETCANKSFVKNFKDVYNRYSTSGAIHGYMAAIFIQEAYKKAGSFKTKKFIKALEGMAIDTPVGKVVMRAYDHQVMLPMYIG